MFRHPTDTAAADDLPDYVDGYLSALAAVCCHLELHKTHAQRTFDQSAQTERDTDALLVEVRALQDAIGCVSHLGSQLADAAERDWPPDDDSATDWSPAGDEVDDDAGDVIRALH